jgi:hypothetical protein
MSKVLKYKAGLMSDDALDDGDIIRAFAGSVYLRRGANFPE